MPTKGIHIALNPISDGGARGPEAEHFVRNLAGKLRIRLVDQSMLQVLA